MGFDWSENVKIVETGTGGFAVDYNTGQCVSMNGTAKVVCDMIEAGADVNGIVEEVTRRFSGTDPLSVAADVSRFIAALQSMGMLAASEE